MLKKGTRRRKRSVAESDFWAETTSLLKTGGVTPLISNYMSFAIFGGSKSLVSESWAKDEVIQSPLSDEDNRNLTRVAQYYSVQKNSLRTKQQYLESLTSYLLGLAEEDEEIPGYLLDRVYEDLEEKTFTAVSTELGFPKFAEIRQNPLRLLAELPLPIYITTSYHGFLEAALKQVPKQPITEIFYWSDTLYHIPSTFDEDPDFKPTVERPLVYHLYGIDQYPESLVLTEDDYLDFLIRIFEENSVVHHSDQRKRMPSSVRQAMVGNLLMLLGYDIYDWEFRVLFRGLIRAKDESRLKPNSPESISLQIEPGEGMGDPERVKEYLENYFKRSRFKVYWGTLEMCVQELYDLWVQ